MQTYYSKLPGRWPAKCASTLNFYLKQHPEIYMSPVKQTKFFSLTELGVMTSTCSSISPMLLLKRWQAKQL